MSISFDANAAKKMAEEANKKIPITLEQCLEKVEDYAKSGSCAAYLFNEDDKLYLPDTVRKQLEDMGYEIYDDIYDETKDVISTHIYWE